MTMPTITMNEHRRQAESVANRYNGELRDIDADPDLTAEARTRRTDEAYTRASGEMRDLMHAERAEDEARRRSAERRLFGLGIAPTSADMISMRDAQDRAGRLAGDETVPAMERAISSGDRTLAKAILSHALRTGSDNAVQAYLTEYPSDKPLVQELRSTDRNFLDVMAYMVMAP